ncbi:helix-turn-helix domain-containing protein [Desulfoscipio geothermicus]|uniref:helix-turn-helix domain-containing protein n=1 Tax=Desulfoscipio geothermicus TaxID=39060 RepID=UPI001A9746EF|nr:helix-turn-helix domain-containing protein [Desulfoscipio geothermicus]
MRTLERYLSLYRKGGWDALKPQPRKSKGNFKIPAAVLQKAIELRRQRPERSVEQINMFLGEPLRLLSQAAPKGSLDSRGPRVWYNNKTGGVLNGSMFPEPPRRWSCRTTRGVDVKATTFALIQLYFEYYVKFYEIISN